MYGLPDLLTFWKGCEHRSRSRGSYFALHPNALIKDRRHHLADHNAGEKGARDFGDVLNELFIKNRTVYIDAIIVYAVLQLPARLPFMSITVRDYLLQHLSSRYRLILSQCFRGASHTMLPYNTNEPPFTQ